MTATAAIRAGVRPEEPASRRSPIGRGPTIPSAGPGQSGSDTWARGTLRRACGGSCSRIDMSLTRRRDVALRTKAVATLRSRRRRPRSTDSGCGLPAASGSGAGARVDSARAPAPGVRSSPGRTAVHLPSETRCRNTAFGLGSRKRTCVAGIGRPRMRRAMRARVSSSTHDSRVRRAAGAARRAGTPAA